MKHKYKKGDIVTFDVDYMSSEPSEKLRAKIVNILPADKYSCNYKLQLLEPHSLGIRGWSRSEREITLCYIYMFYKRYL